jgi:hypothetical protein
MPIKSCESDKKPGFKWGDQGKCYTYEPKNEGSLRNARKKATSQGIAIGDIKFQDLRVSFDYHDTLTTDKGKKLLEKEFKDNNLIYIISAAQDVKELLPFAEKYGIRKDRVFATGSNQKKVDKIKELNIVRHYDNAQQVKDILDKRDDVKVELIKV